MLLRVAAALFLLTIVTYSGVRMASGLTCYSCTNWDNTSKCLDPELDYYGDIKIEKCNKSWEVGRKKAFCVTEVQYDCQSTVFKDSKDLVGNGGGIYKRWVRFGCAFIDVSKEPLKSHKDCYWVRTRGARDVLHQITGFQVIGRSSIHRMCYCNDEDNCNYVRLAESMCDRECGPQCKQVSRDECVSGLTEEARNWPRDQVGKTKGKPLPNDENTSAKTPEEYVQPEPGLGDYGSIDTENHDGDYYKNEGEGDVGFYDVADTYDEDTGASCKCEPSTWPDDRDTADHVDTERQDSYVPSERQWKDCGIDEKRMTPTLIGGRTYRHIGIALGHRDGVRDTRSIGSRKRVPLEMLVLSIATILLYYGSTLYGNFSCRMLVDRFKRILLLRQTQNFKILKS